MSRLRNRKEKKIEKNIVSWCIERLDLPVAPQSLYEGKTHLLLLLLAAVRNLFLESALAASKKLGAESPPSPRGFLYRLRVWSSKGLLNDALVHLNREVLKEARRRRRLPKAAVAAIDYTDNPYYGKKERRACCRGPEKRGTRWFHRVAALSLIVRGGRYTIAWINVLPLTSHKKVVETLLDAAEEWVRLKLVIMDRGFYGRRVSKLLKAKEIKVLLAVPKWKREKKAVNRCKGLNWTVEPWGFDDQEGWTLIVADNEWLRSMLKDRRVERGYSLWLTDLPFRGKPLPLIRAYNRRWSIENAFQEEDRFQAKTKSPDIRLRFSIIFLSAVLRNLWLLLKGGCDEFTSFLIREVMYIEALSYLKGEKGG